MLPADQTIDVHFDEFMADDLAMVARVYDLAGQPLDARARGPPWRRSWPRTRGAGHGAGRLRPGRVRPRHASSAAQALAFYTERFGVTIRAVGRHPAPAMSDQRMDGTTDAAPAARHVQAQVHQQHRTPTATCHPISRNGIPTLTWVEYHLVAREQIVGPRGEHVDGQEGQEQRPTTPAAPGGGTTSGHVPGSRATRGRCGGVAPRADRRAPRTPAQRPGAACPQGVNVTVASKAPKAASTQRWTAKRVSHPAALGHQRRSLTARETRSSPGRGHCGGSPSPTPLAGWRSPSSPFPPTPSQ